MTTSSVPARARSRWLLEYTVFAVMIGLLILATWAAAAALTGWWVMHRRDA